METLAKVFVLLSIAVAAAWIVGLCVSGLQGRDAEKEHEEWEESRKE